LLEFVHGGRMRFWPLFLLMIAALSVAQRCAAQDALLSGPAAAPALETPLPIAAPETPLYAAVTKTSPERAISWGRLLPNMVQDQKQIWLFPVSVAHGHHLAPTLAVVGLTAGLVALDGRNGRYFRTTQSFRGFNKAFSGSNTSLGMEVFPAAFYIVGLARKDSYAQHTVLLAGEAVLDSEILTSVMKDVDRRSRPAAISTNGNCSDSWFEENRGSYLGGVGSFPSGHTIAAFSIATVFANRYPNPRWHIWLAYGLASLVGFSRVSRQSHFPSDVFAGAALGYAIAHYVVLRPRSIPVEKDTP
jgi:membrane-associated phospholipid phosphatase